MGRGVRLPRQPLHGRRRRAVDVPRSGRARRLPGRARVHAQRERRHDQGRAAPSGSSSRRPARTRSRSRSPTPRRGSRPATTSSRGAIRCRRASCSRASCRPPPTRSSSRPTCAARTRADRDGASWRAPWTCGQRACGRGAFLPHRADLTPSSEAKSACRFALPDEGGWVRSAPVVKVHLIGIGGTGMGAVAGLLVEAGHEVRGSDAAVYPPMSEQLAALGVPVMMPYGADEPRLGARPRRGRQRARQGSRRGRGGAGARHPADLVPGGARRAAARRQALDRGLRARTARPRRPRWSRTSSREAGRDPVAVRRRRAGRRSARASGSARARTS